MAKAADVWEHSVDDFIERVVDNRLDLKLKIIEPSHLCAAYEHQATKSAEEGACAKVGHTCRLCKNKTAR